MLYTSSNCACALFYAYTARPGRCCGLRNDIRSTTVRLLQTKLIYSPFLTLILTGSHTESALKVHRDFGMAVYVPYGLCYHSPAPWVQSDVPPEVAKRLCDASTVAPGTSRLAAEKFGPSRYHNSGSFESQEVILGCFDIY